VWIAAKPLTQSKVKTKAVHPPDRLKKGFKNHYTEVLRLQVFIRADKIEVVISENNNNGCQ
jgi:hypothetical protein